MNTPTQTQPARAYRPAWTHHPRGGKIHGFATKAHRGERGLALTEERARANDPFSTYPAAQVFQIDNPPTVGTPPRPFIIIPAMADGHTPHAVAEVTIGGHSRQFIQPIDDQTGLVAWMQILNSGLAYAITYAGQFALASLRGTTSASIAEILSTHDTAADMTNAFFREQANRRTTQY